MKRILLLGGTGEALQLARRLAPHHDVTYSLAGRTRRTLELPCAVSVGGFGGVTGLTDFLKNGRFTLLIDATHPYAARISRHAVLAAKATDIPLWAYRRPPWHPTAGVTWRFVDGWINLKMALSAFCRPFFTIGQEPLTHVESIPPTQHWLIRCLAAQAPSLPNLIVLNAFGPFTVEAELAVMQRYGVDALVSKNSGGSAVAAKLEAARLLKIPVLMLERPRLPAVDREFDDIVALSDQLIRHP